MSRDVDWILPAMILLLVQHSCALLLSRAIGFAERPPTLSYMLMALVLATLGGLALFLRKLWRLWRKGEAHPAKRLRTDADWSSVWTYFIGFQLVGLQFAALTWLKAMIPLAVPYWADGILASFDRSLIGTDAWRIMPITLVRPLDAVYPFWGLVKSLTLLMFLALPASRLKSRAMLAYFLTVGLIGVSGQFLLSSGGPIFYDRLMHSAEFGELAARTKEFAPIAHTASEYLWHSYLVGDIAIGGGISAMPSIHVATTTWTAIALSRIWPKSAVPIWAFWVVIFAGSIALGWHYLSDGLVGAGGALICWAFAPRILQLLAQFRSKSPAAVPVPSRESSIMR